MERILGFAPMGMLPDFHEVSSGVSEEYMLRLAAAVEHAYQEGAMKSCIFTAVAPGAGATTLASRVTDMLQVMGRETVLVDASGMPPAEANGGHPDSTELVASPRGTRSTALLQQMADVTAGESIVITDTAPLLASGETEYLARFVDSAIVVIQSGVTTKTQLRELAKTLQRLDVAAVGFVLNRVSLAKANGPFRDSVRAVEQHLQAQSRAYARNTARNQQPAQAQRETHAEPRVARTRHKADAVPVSVPEPVAASRPDIASEQSMDAHVRAPQEIPPDGMQDRKYDRKSHQREEAATPVPEVREPVPAPEPVVSNGYHVASEPVREPAFVAAESPYAAHRFITPEPTFDPTPVGGARASVYSAPRAVAPAEPTPSPVAPQEPVRAEHKPSRPAPPPVTAQVPRGREPMRPAPPAVVHAHVGEAPQYVPPAPVADRPKPAAPARPTVEARIKPPAAVPPAEPAAPAKFGADSPVPASVAFNAASIDPPASPRPTPSSHASRTGPRTNSADFGPVQTPGYRTAEPASPGPASTARPAAPDEETDDLPYSAASRLGGLRTLLVSLGLKALNKEADLHGRSADVEPQYERTAERPVYAEPVTYSPARGSIETLPPDAASVKAKPEFLPPEQVAAETTEREKEPVRPVPKRLRWDAPEDVETLPSWRGQYRKRR